MDNKANPVEALANSQNMGSEKGNSLKKPMRRRSSHGRRASSSSSQNCAINMAKARREIAHALHIHRSSSSTSSSSSSSSCVTNVQPILLGNTYNNYDFTRPSFGGSQYCYSLMESMTMTMPIPDPIWSTTAPSILAAPPQPGMEAVEFEWGENNQASHTWWLGFLKTLDSKYNEEPKYPLGALFSQCQQEGPKIGEPPFLYPSDQSASPDEWLIFPATEDQGEIVNPPKK
ncbi:hypothetical protein CMV_001294 [Castanea mollissima]|uniref:Uncharacterized protein n=1 Tax=Castanea mollissima TaxID=60419 RepID=A0A8J4W4H7_9ROSI|nr:hypothetical protein CMV_001294 [Castanea mollissima]